MNFDFQHLLNEFRDLFDVVEQASTRGGQPVSVLLNYPFMKIVANRAFHALARLLGWRDCRDLTNNLKFMRREVVERLQLLQPGWR